MIEVVVRHYDVSVGDWLGNLFAAAGMIILVLLLSTIITVLVWRHAVPPLSNKPREVNATHAIAVVKQFQLRQMLCA